MGFIRLCIRQPVATFAVVILVVIAVSALLFGGNPDLEFQYEGFD